MTSPEKSLAPSVFGLTGGMGSGKTTVSHKFAECGAYIIDADQIVRDLQEPGQPILLGMVAILGDDIILESGELDRKKADNYMFNDKEKINAIHELIHPLLWSVIRQIIHDSKDNIIILDVPLLFETKPNNIETRGDIVVDVEQELAIYRLMEFRGYSEDEAKERIAQQMPREQKLKLADYVIFNNGSLDDLAKNIDCAWGWILAQI